MTESVPRFTYSQMSDLVSEHAAEAECVVIQAGHFLVYYNSSNDTLFPCIMGEGDSVSQEQAVIATLGQFPILSWELGLRLLDDCTTPRKWVCVVVNDWQYTYAARRERFFSKWKRLPSSFQDMLDMRGGAVQLLSPVAKRQGLSTAPFFSETTLRNQYTRRVQSMVAKNQLPGDIRMQVADKHVKRLWAEIAGREHEVYCAGQTASCAAEIAELICQIWMLTSAAGNACDLFINLFPSVCRDYIALGTELSREVLNAGVKKVINVGLPSGNVRNVEEFLASANVMVQNLGD